MREELCLGAIRRLRLQHLLVGDIRSRLGILLGIHEGQTGDRPVKQRPQLRTISLQQRFAFASSAVAHQSSLPAESVRLAGKAIIVKIRLRPAITRPFTGAPSVAGRVFLTVFPCPRAFPTRYMRYGHAAFRTAARRGTRADEHRQDPPRDRADARSSKRHDWLPAAVAGAGGLRPSG